MSTTEHKALYADRNPRKLEPHYTAHVLAMTREDLHSKSDIAAELAWRDQQVEALRAQLPDFQGLPKRKLEDLLAEGYRINGFAIAREVEGSDPQRGFITVDGLVGWWTPGLQALERAHEAMEKLRVRCEQAEAVERERDELRAQVEALADANDSAAWHKRRTSLLQSLQSAMQEPERTIVCDVLANGHLLQGPDGKPDKQRYAAPSPLTRPAVPDHVSEAQAAVARNLEVYHLVADRRRAEAVHPDDAAIDCFADEALKPKMAEGRAKGRSGWETCPPEVLSRMLHEHVEKGDPRDVALFCMMLWSMGARIAAAPQPPVEVTRPAVPEGWKLVPVEPTPAMLQAYLDLNTRFHSARSDWAAMLAAAPQPPYKDSTPHLSVGESSFESWYSTYDAARKGDKQRARDAYAAGMGDPLVQAAPQPEAQPTEAAQPKGRV